jgi:hypothetical protein
LAGVAVYSMNICKEYAAILEYMGIVPFTNKRVVPLCFFQLLLYSILS